MKECKVLEFSNVIRHELSTFGGSTYSKLSDFPAVEKELSKYLSQGYKITSFSQTSMTMFFVLERG